MIFVLTHDDYLTRYLFNGLEDIKAILYPVPHNSFLLRAVKFIARKMNLLYGSMSLSRKQKKILKGMNEKDVFIYIGESAYACRALSNVCKKNVKKIAFFWNSCTTVKNCEDCIKIIRESGFSIATFDSEDAQRFNLLFANQFYRKISSRDKTSCKIENDFFFCGRNKGRKYVLLEMQRQFSSLGSCRFFISEKQESMNYLDYIENVKKTRVLCDVNQKNQAGLTLRVLESLFFSKKLITNNTFVDKYDFYNPSNILIYTSRTTKDDVQAFLMNPYKPVNAEILSRYEVENVLKKVIQETKN